MYSHFFLLSPLVLFFTPATSWGNLGHRTIGYLAQQYMTPQATGFFNGIINPSDSFDISDAAIWADSHRQGGWAYTYNWHFIDARDDPPNECSVKLERDCDTRERCASHKDPGCVVGAIANMTSQITSTVTTDDSTITVQDAMKFLLHFVGDSHQPLHAENLDIGGNSICISWHGNTDNHAGHSHSHRIDDHSDRIVDQPEGINSGHSDPHCPKGKKCINLHAAWDTLMIEKLIDYQEPEDRRDKDQVKAAEKAAAQQWATELFGDRVGNPELDADDCVPTPGNPDDSITCALKWASESNNFVCSYVLKDGVDAVEGQELSGDYYEGAVPIIKGQITRAARRFAAILNAIASANSAPEHRVVEQVAMDEL